VELLRLAVAGYDEAMRDSAFAPPSPGYVDRVRAIADACERVAVTMIDASEAAGVGWRPKANLADELPYELRPGGNRPGNGELWAEFDATFERLAITATGSDIIAVANGFREAGDALGKVADEFEGDDEWRAWERLAT